MMDPMKNIMKLDSTDKEYRFKVSCVCEDIGCEQYISVHSSKSDDIDGHVTVEVSVNGRYMGSRWRGIWKLLTGQELPFYADIMMEPNVARNYAYLLSNRSYWAEGKHDVS